jgi:hypothetical protein
MVPLWISSRPNLSAAARPAQNRPGSDPSLVEEDIDLALQCGAAIGTALLGELQGAAWRGSPCGVSCGWRPLARPNSVCVRD